MIVQPRAFSWGNWEDYSDKDLVKIARTYYRNIKHPERLKRGDLIFRMDSMNVDDLPWLFLECGRVKNFFLMLWDRLCEWRWRKAR